MKLKVAVHKVQSIIDLRVGEASRTNFSELLASDLRVLIINFMFLGIGDEF